MIDGRFFSSAKHRPIRIEQNIYESRTNKNKRRRRRRRVVQQACVGDKRVRHHMFDIIETMIESARYACVRQVNANKMELSLSRCARLMDENRSDVSIGSVSEGKEILYSVLSLFSEEWIERKIIIIIIL